MGDILWSIVMVLAIAMCSIWRMHPEKETNALSMAESVNIKGIAACMIVCSHIYMFTDKFHAFSVVAYLFTGVFFLYSGYGITCGLRKQNERKEKAKYLMVHAGKLLVMFVITESLYYVFFLAFSDIEFSVSDILLRIIRCDLLASQMWFVLALCVLYACMSAGILVVPKISYEVLSFLGIFVYILWQVAIGAEFYRLQSCIAFPVGVAFASNQELYRKVVYGRFRKRWPGILAVAGVFLASFLSVYLLKYLIGDHYIVRVIWGWISVASFLILMMKFLDGRVMDNRILRVIGRNSTEIYAVHLLVLFLLGWLFQEWIGRQNPILLFFVVIIVVLFLAELQKYVAKKLKRAGNRKKI